MALREQPGWAGRPVSRSDRVVRPFPQPYPWNHIEGLAYPCLGVESGPERMIRHGHLCHQKVHGVDLEKGPSADSEGICGLRQTVRFQPIQNHRQAQEEALVGWG